MRRVDKAPDEGRDGKRTARPSQVISVLGPPFEMDQIRAAMKFLGSFGKRDWCLEDYPVRVLHRPSAESGGRRRAYSWTAQIINWWHMRGDGFTQDQALQHLADRFRAFKASSALPRPGRGVPPRIELAATTVVDEHRDLVRDLVQRVIGLNPGDCLVTDESSLWDFHDGDGNAEYCRKIALLYGVDVSGVEPPTLAGICRKIREHQGA